MSTKEEIKARLMKLAPKANCSDYLDNDLWREACEAFAEKLAESATQVQGYEGENRWYGMNISMVGTPPVVTALLIDVQPIERAVSQAEVLQALKSTAKGLSRGGDYTSDTITELTELANRIEKHGIAELAKEQK